MKQNNVVMVGLTVSMHFQQFEDLKFQIFPLDMPPEPPKTPVSLELAWLIIPWQGLINLFFFLFLDLMYAPPHEKSWLWSWNSSTDFVPRTGLFENKLNFLL